MSAPYFTQDTIDFIYELALNNEKPWFNTNKQRYIDSVKDPFAIFTADTVADIKKLDKDVTVEPAKAIFRIYRDVRFSKDKTPYKTWVSFGFGRDKKDLNFPGYTVRIGADDGLSIGGGVYAPSKETLLRIRRGIMKDNGKELEAIINAPSFKKTWGNKLSGERNKVLPKEFKQAAASSDWLYHKQWIYWQSYPIDTILQGDLRQIVRQHFTAAQQLHAYFKQFCD